jgi:predicted naringenin-chalcone synthase
MEIVNFMAGAAGMTELERRKLIALYRSTGIRYRHSVLPDFGLPNGRFTFFPNTPDLEPFPQLESRMQVFRQQALPLCVQASDNCLKNVSQMDRSRITHLITVSCTGMYAPGIDIELVEHLDLPTHVQRTAINFMGCYGAFNGLKSADAICRAAPMPVY